MDGELPEQHADAGRGAAYVVQCNGLEVGMVRKQGGMPKQAPFAVVVGCSDARVPTEMIFGQGFNDLFVIRVAGNVLGDVCLGSIDFAVEALERERQGPRHARPQRLRRRDRRGRRLPAAAEVLVEVHVAVAAVDPPEDLRRRARGGQRPRGSLGPRRAAHARLPRGPDRDGRLPERGAGRVRAPPGGGTAGRWEIEVFYGVYNLHNHQVSMPHDPSLPPSDRNVRLTLARRTPRSSPRSPSNGRDPPADLETAGLGTAGSGHVADRPPGAPPRPPGRVSALPPAERPTLPGTSRVPSGRFPTAAREGPRRTRAAPGRPARGATRRPAWGRTRTCTPPPHTNARLVARRTRTDPVLSRLAKLVEHAAHLLPAQGPITVFIHHNTLHAFEDLPFHEAVKKGAQVFGCQPYLTEDRYREELNRGRIRFAELQEVLEEDLGDAGRGADPLLRHAARPAAGDAPVSAADRADGGAGLVRRRGQRAAAGPPGGVVGRPRAG